MAQYTRTHDVDWPAGIYIWDPQFKTASDANAGRYMVSPEGTVVDKSTGKQPPLIYGLPFPEVDAKTIGIEYVSAMDRAVSRLMDPLAGRENRGQVHDRRGLRPAAPGQETDLAPERMPPRDRRSCVPCRVLRFRQASNHSGSGRNRGSRISQFRACSTGKRV